MRYLILLLLLPSLALADVFGEYELTPEQQRLLAMAYIIGEEHDLGETTQAVLFQETLAGAYGDGIGDKINGHLKQSYGVMQIKIATARWVFWKKPELMKEMFGYRPGDIELRDALIDDDALNIRIGVANLKLLRHYTNNWVEMVVAYNTGLGGMKAVPDVREHHYYTLVASKMNMVIRPYNDFWESQQF